MTLVRGLELPEPARELWLRTRTIINEELGRIQGGDAGYAIGGGTILAARWRHRESFDVDIIVDPETPLHRANDPRQSDFNRRMREIGGNVAYSPELDKYKIAFDGGRDVDLWARSPIFGSTDRRERVEGREESVFSTAQILRGKLERAEMNVVRDVYDVVEAAKREPESLEDAVNAIPRAAAERIAWCWYHASPMLCEDARTRLRGTGNPADDYRSLGGAAAGAVHGALYDALEIRAGGGRITVTMQTAAGARRSRRVTPEEADEHFEERGLNAHLSNKGPGAGDLREYAKAQARRREGDRLIYRETKDTPTHWRGAAGADEPHDRPRDRGDGQPE